MCLGLTLLSFNRLMLDFWAALRHVCTCLATWKLPMPHAHAHGGGGRSVFTLPWGRGGLTHGALGRGWLTSLPGISVHERPEFVC